MKYINIRHKCRLIEKSKRNKFKLIILANNVHLNSCCTAVFFKILFSIFLISYYANKRVIVYGFVILCHPHAVVKYKKKEHKQVLVKICPFLIAP